MNAVRDGWTDERLDDLNGKVDGGFRRMDDRFGDVDARLGRIEGRMESQFNRMDTRLDDISRSIVFCALTLSGAMLTGFIAVFTVILTGS